MNNTVTQHLRFLYRGYLQIGAYNALNGNFQWFILWDPTEPVATRPLAIRKDGTWYAYGIDLIKNVSEAFGPAGYIRSRYDYTPSGSVTATGDVTQPIQWSSEYSDTELGLVYYNYRHYNPEAGRWINRDPIAEEGGYNLYGFMGNKGISVSDNLRLWSKENILKKICCSKYKEYIKLIKDYKIISFDSIYIGFPMRVKFFQ